jgi:hypothetical protein
VLVTTGQTTAIPAPVSADHPGLRGLHAAVDELAPGWPAVPAEPGASRLPEPESGST